MSAVVRRAYQFSWLLLAALYPAIFAMSPTLAPLLLLLLVPLLLRFVAFGRPWPATPFNGALLLLLLMVAVSLWATPDVALSLPKVAGIMYGIILFWVLVDLAQRSRGHWLLLAVATALLGTGLSIVGLVGFSARLQTELPFVPAVNPNEVGGVITWTLPLLLMLGSVAWLDDLPIRPLLRRLATLLFGALVLLTGAILLATGSRSAWIGCAVALLFLLLLLLRRRPLPLLGVAAAAVLSPLLLREAAVDALLSGPPDSGAAISLSGRIEIWSRALYALSDFPLTGMGMNIFRDALHILYPLFSIPPTTDLGHAHNHLLQAGVDLGLPGLVAYLAIWIACALTLLQSWRTVRTSWQQVLIAGVGASLLAFFVYGITDAIALGAKPGFLLWMLFALAASSARRHRVSRQVGH